VVVAICRVHEEIEFRQLHDLFAEYEAGLPKELRHGSVPDVAALRERYERRDAAFLAISRGSAIGCVAVTKFDAETALMLRLYVQPHRRGLGAARWLVGAAIAFSREQGRRRIALDTNKEQLMPAYRLYRSLGFEECEPFATVTYEFPTFMELRLGS
jgi:GNAT superfamily N-acetyltransferase